MILRDRKLGNPACGVPQECLADHAETGNERFPEPRAAEMRGLPLSELVALRDKHRVWLETAELNEFAKQMQRKTM